MKNVMFFLAFVALLLGCTDNPVGPDTKPPVVTPPVDPPPTSIVKKFATLSVENNRNVIRIVDTNGSNEKLLDVGRDWESSSIDVSSDGKTIVYASEGIIYLIDIQTGGVGEFAPTSSGMYPMDPAFVLGGNSIVYHARDNYDSFPQLYTADIQIGVATRHTMNECPELDPNSPDYEVEVRKPCFNGTMHRPVAISREKVVTSAYMRGTAPVGCTIGVDCYPGSSIIEIDLKTGSWEMLAHKAFPDFILPMDFSEPRREVVIMERGNGVLSPTLYSLNTSKSASRLRTLSFPCQAISYSKDRQDVLCQNSGILQRINPDTGLEISKSYIPVVGTISHLIEL